MSEPLTSGSLGRKLETWKEIAACCGVTVRTVQLWEAERGLPVHRQAGPKGRVWAWEHEIQEWLARVSESPAPEAPLKTASQWKRWAMPAALVLIATAAVSAHRAFRPGPVAGWRQDGAVLAALDAGGRTVWQHRFEHAPRSLSNIDHLPRPAYSAIQHIDLDGDSRMESVVPFRSPQRGADRVYCFGPEGDLQWSYAPTEEVEQEGGRVLPNFELRSVVALPGTGRGSDVLASFYHLSLSANVLVRLDAKGKVRSEYWHAGHLTSLRVADLDGNGRPEIYSTACSNSYGGGELVVLDPERMNGASREENAYYQIRGKPLAQELARVIFPTTALGRRRGAMFACAYQPRIDSQGLEIVLLDGGIEQWTGEHSIGLSTKFEPRYVTFSSAARADYRKAFEKGETPYPTPDGEAQELLRVRRIER